MYSLMTKQQKIKNFDVYNEVAKDKALRAYKPNNLLAWLARPTKLMIRGTHRLWVRRAPEVRERARGTQLYTAVLLVPGVIAFRRVFARSAFEGERLCIRHRNNP